MSIEDEFDIESYQILRSRLVQQYEQSPKFHAMVDHFHSAVQTGTATFDGLFGALLLAKECFVQNGEMRIRERLPREEKSLERYKEKCQKKSSS